MDERPRSLRTMLSEAKDTSEIMVDLAYAAVYFNDPGMATEVAELEERMNDLVQDMRAVCIMAVRRQAEAEGMASVLQIISAIESIANAARSVTRVVTHRLGIPDELLADLADAEEVSHRVWVRDGSHMARRPLKDLELTVQCGMRIMAIRRDRSWMIDEVDGDTVLIPGDVLFLRGAPTGISRLHELAAAPTWEPPAQVDRAITDLDRAVDVLVEMKNISEVAVGLAYSALRLRDSGLASEVQHLAERLDEMKDHLQLWVLRAAKKGVDPSHLRGLLQLASASEEIGNQAGEIVWLITDDRGFHPIVNIALGEADEVAVQVPVADGAPVANQTLRDLELDVEPGFQVLAIRRDNRYLYRPRAYVRLEAGDQLIASGPHEGHARLAELCGWHLIEDDEDDPTGEVRLEPLGLQH